MKRFEVTVFLVEVSDKFIQMSLQIVISMYFQVVILSCHFHVFSCSNNVTTSSRTSKFMYLQGRTRSTEMT